ncbi:uncharacterized protein TrAtP1_012064 [Trichoderma atroviride]|uniref:uncharacterized protein n=1 Tax=Hypocrea atroviridis TaxID=63577 RepID=UPI0033237F1D|nr:hypothetical protein TrAtP1_012064 [Trichoderma atroviride]
MYSQLGGFGVMLSEAMRYGGFGSPAGGKQHQVTTHAANHGWSLDPTGHREGTWDMLASWRGVWIEAFSPEETI